MTPDPSDDYLMLCQRAVSALLRDDVPTARALAYQAHLSLAAEVTVSSAMVALEGDLRRIPPRPGPFAA